MNRPPVIEYRAKGGEVVLRHVASYSLPRISCLSCSGNMAPCLSFWSGEVVRGMSNGAPPLLNGV